MIDLSKKTENNKNLVILSIPFQRLIRSHLYEPFLKELRKNSDLIIVSPFADNESFKKKLNGNNIYHFNCQRKLNISIISRSLINITNVLRIRGYWLRRAKDIPACWASRYLKEDKNNYYKKVNFPSRIIIKILSFIGLWEKSWRILESLYAPKVYVCKELINCSRKYKNIVLIQASSWGMQDAMLAFMSKKENWRTILIPYTSDQIYMNGYLYCKYDYICTQGRLETIWSKNFHGVEDKRIFKLGSLYLNRLKIIKEELNDKIYKRDRILYIGISPRTFPEEIEIEAVKKLYEYINSHCKLKFIYRPVRENKKDYETLKNKLKHLKNLKFEIPSATCLGLRTYENEEPNIELKKHVSNLSKTVLMISSYTSSIYIEGAYLDVPTLSYIPKKNKKIKFLAIDKWLNKKNQLIYSDLIPVACSKEELISNFIDLYEDKKLRKDICDEVKNDWHYEHKNMYHNLKKILDFK